MTANATPLSDAALALLAESRRLADGYRHEEWTEQHVLGALLRTARGLLVEGGCDVASLAAALDERVRTMPTLRGRHSPLAGSRPAPQIDHLRDRATDYAALAGYDAAGVAHLVLALLQATGDASAMLAASGLRADRLIEAARDEGEEPDLASDALAGLGAFGHDLVALAERGQLDPVVGRANEIARLFQLLNRRTKNNPVLIGEPGVGKTAIVEGLARLIASGDVPPRFRGVRILSLNLAGLLATSGNRGEFEGRLNSLLIALRRARRSIILFVDEAHLLVGAGAAQGGLDAASILKPALARGEFAFIGATTPDAYRRYIESDSALERRLAPVWVAEPSPADAVAILNGVRPLLESHHGVTIDTAALAAAVDLSIRYLPGRRLPDKAIDLVDEAASRAALDGRDGDDLSFSDPRVTADSIAHVLNSLTGVPVGRLLEDESARLMRLEAQLRESVVGQDHAIATVVAAIHRSRSGLSERAKPVANFLFAGPRGVGKTTFAHSLAAALFGEREALLRIDMREYAERHTVSRLLGAPPGYVGHGEAAVLTETVRRRPFQVILFDEIGHAHPEVLQLLAQLMDSGRLTDGQGRSINFRNCLVVMTMTTGTGVPGGDTANAHLRTLPAELRAAFDDVVWFNPLSQQHTAAITAIRITEVAAALARQGLRLEISPAARASLIATARSGDSDAGGAARAIQEHLVDPISRCLIQERPVRGSTIHVAHRRGRFAVASSPPLEDSAPPAEPPPTATAPAQPTVSPNGLQPRPMKSREPRDYVPI